MGCQGLCLTSSEWITSHGMRDASYGREGNNSTQQSMQPEYTVRARTYLTHWTDTPEIIVTGSPVLSHARNRTEMDAGTEENGQGGWPKSTFRLRTCSQRVPASYILHGVKTGGQIGSGAGRRGEQGSTKEEGEIGNSEKDLA